MCICSCGEEEAGAEVLFENAGDAFAAGDPQTAESLLLQVTLMEPENTNALYNLGTVRISKGDYEGAVEAYQAVIDVDSFRVDALTGLTGALVGCGRLEEALHTGSLAVELNPSDGMAFNNYGMALLETGSYQEAAACFSTALRRDPENVSIRYNCGRMSMMAGDPLEALEFYDSVLSQAPRHYGAALGRANALGLLERYEDAEEAALVILASWPGDLEGRKLLALSYTGRELYGEAIEVLEGMAADASGDPMIRLGLADCYYALGDFDSALAEYGSFMGMLPDTAGTAGVRERIQNLEDMSD